MSADDPLASAVADWQHKHRIADGDPMIAALELVRIYSNSAFVCRATMRSALAAPNRCKSRV